MKKILSLVLALAMVLTLLPAAVYAEEGAATPTDVTAEELAPAEEGTTEADPAEEAPDAEIAGEKPAVGVLSGQNPFADEADEKEDPLFAALTFLPYEDVTTVITDVKGKTHTYRGCLDVADLENHKCCEDIASYRIYFGKTMLLEATLHDVTADDQGAKGDGEALTNGYYAAKFDVSQTQECFLTNMTAENWADVQDEILHAAISDKDVEITRADFIDAEKVGTFENLNGETDTDSGLCWAATACNMLTYSGWGEAAGYGTTDYLFDLYSTVNDDQAGWATCGLEWFFNGYCTFADAINCLSDGSYGTFKGHFPDVPVENVMETVNVRYDRQKLSCVTDRLEEGCAVGMTIGFYYEDDNVRYGGHVITLWGYVRSKTDPNSYSHLIFGDSDSDKKGYDDRRAAPNKVRIASVSDYDLFGLNTLQLNYYKSGNSRGYGANQISTRLELFTILKPYSADTVDTFRETFGDGDRFQNPDFMMYNIVFDTVPDVWNTKQTVLPADRPQYVSPRVVNVAECTFNPDNDPIAFPVRIQLYQNGLPLGDALEYQENSTDSLGKQYVFMYCTVPIGIRDGEMLTPLPAGQYTMEVTVNPERTITEANYSNNTTRYDFTVAAASPTDVMGVIMGDYYIRSNGFTRANVTFTDLPDDGEHYYLYRTFRKGEDSSDPSLVWDSDAPPTTLLESLSHDYDTVEYRCLVQYDPTQPMSEYRSEPIAFRCIYYDTDIGAGNVYCLADVPQGAASYLDGEMTAFTIEDRSRGGVNGPMNWALYAYRDEDDAEYTLRHANGITLDPGQIITVTNTSLVAEETGQPLPPGRYEIYAAATFTDLMSGEDFDTVTLGYITVCAAQDVISLTAEALRVDRFIAMVGVTVEASPDVYVRVGAAISTDSDFPEEATTIQWFTGYKKNVTVHEDDGLFNILPGQTYYCRPAAQVWGDDSIYFDFDDEPISFTARTDRFSALTLNVATSTTLVGSADPLTMLETGVWNYLFTPAESGWYRFTVTGSKFDLVMFTDVEDAWESREGINGTYQKDFYVEAGEKLRIILSTQKTTPVDCTITVIPTPVTVTEYAVTATDLQFNGKTATVTVRGDAPRNSRFYLGVEYGPDKEHPATQKKLFEPGFAEFAETTVTFGCRMGTVCWFRPYLEDADTHEKVYGAYQLVQADACNGAPLLPGTYTDLVLAKNETVTLRSYAADHGGTFTLHLSGRDGKAAYWSSGSWGSRQFSLGGQTVTGHLEPGETLIVWLTGYAPDAYRVAYTFTPDESGDCRLLRVGNVNGSGLADTPDVTDMECLYKYLSRGVMDGALGDDESYFRSVADVTGDGDVNILDYQALYEAVRQS